MQSFKDHAGRSWEVSVNVASVKRVRRLLDIDLPALINDKSKGLGELVADDCRLVDVLYVLCKEQADRLGVSDEQFGAAMLGDAIVLGRDAFLEALTDFFRDPRVRAGLRKVIEAARRMEAKLLERLERETASLDPEAMAEELAQKYGKSLTTALASSGSTPVPSVITSSSE